jgi:hypothetical protein
VADGSAERTVTIHSSWRGIAGGFLGASVIALGGSYGLASIGPRPLPVAIAAVGWCLFAVMAADFPLASTFSATGVERRMLLRRQLLSWRSDDRLSRTAPRIIWADRRLEHGGLTLVRGRRRYLLVDRPESGFEFDALIETVEIDGAPGADLGVSSLPRPADSVPPTWLYRRSKWRPDDVASR